MKTVLLSCFAMFAFWIPATGQTVMEWMILSNNRSTNPDVAALQQLWEEVHQAFNANLNEKAHIFYTEEAAEIGPDGAATYGREALLSSWALMVNMADRK